MSRPKKALIGYKMSRPNGRVYGKNTLPWGLIITLYQSAYHISYALVQHVFVVAMIRHHRVHITVINHTFIINQTRDADVGVT